VREPLDLNPVNKDSDEPRQSATIFHSGCGRVHMKHTVGQSLDGVVLSQLLTDCLDG
jgi:hypothetical protein